MGSFLRNFLVRRAKAATVGAKLTKWLERKGFDLILRPKLFPCDEESERGLFIFSNSDWVVIVFSHAIEEGDRLLQTLDDEPAIVDVWVHDSDIWGYDLVEKGELTVSFNSNPQYFGSDEQKLPDNGDPEKLCRVIGMAGAEQRIRKTQKRREMFTDVSCDEFCNALNASAGNLHFDAMDEWDEGRGVLRRVADWLVQPLYLERRRPINEDVRELELHSLAVRSFETKERARPAIPDEYVKEMQSRMRGVTLSIRVIGFLLKPFLWILMLPFRLKFRQMKRDLQTHMETGELPASKSSAHPLFEALDRSEPVVERSGDWLINRRHHCRIRVSSPAPERALFIPENVFFFDMNGVKVNCQAIRPAAMHKSFTLHQVATLVSDEKFMAGPHPARRLVTQWKHGEKTTLNYQWFVELTEVIYVFGTAAESGLPRETVDRIQAVVQTFESTP